jgi:hypothetical protein
VVKSTTKVLCPQDRCQAANRSFQEKVLVSLVLFGSLVSASAFAAGDEPSYETAPFLVMASQNR